MRHRFCCWLSVALLAPGVTSARADGPPAIPVTQQPEQREFTDAEDFTGRLDAVSAVSVRARVSGYLVQTRFKDGADVKKGDVLFEIDPRPYRAELDRAEAKVKQSEAHFKLVDLEYQRAVRLRKTGTLSQEEFDRLAGKRDEVRAYLILAQAERVPARINLEYTRVTAPISGHIGRCLVDPGNLVKADDTVLASLVSVAPIYCYFDMDERTFLRCRRLLRGRKPTDPPLPLVAGLADDEGFPHKGTLDFIDNKVDPRTGTVRLRGVLANRDGIFLPGLFARVRLPLGKPRRVLVVPEGAILSDAGKKYLLVVKDNKVERRPIRVGKLLDKARVIEEGLKADDWVVVGGLEKVRPGDTIELKRTPPPPPPRD